MTTDMDRREAARELTGVDLRMAEWQDILREDITRWRAAQGRTEERDV